MREVVVTGVPMDHSHPQRPADLLERDLDPRERLSDRASVSRVLDERLQLPSHPQPASKVPLEPTVQRRVLQAIERLARATQLRP